MVIKEKLDEFLELYPFSKRAAILTLAGLGLTALVLGASVVGSCGRNDDYQDSQNSQKSDYTNNSPSQTYNVKLNLQVNVKQR